MISFFITLWDLHRVGRGISAVAGVCTKIVLPVGKKGANVGWGQSNQDFGFSLLMNSFVFLPNLLKD